MRQALELALEALEDYVDEYGPWSDDSGAQYVLRVVKEALAQPEQEPVAKVTSETGDPDITMSWWHEPALPVGTPLYTTPPHRKPLSDEQLKEIWLKGKDHGDDWLDVQGIARAIEAAHNIKE